MDELSSILQEMGYEDVVIFSDYDYVSAFIGVSHDGRAIYDYNLMIDWLVENENMTDIEAAEWIDYNTIRALPYQPDAPIVMYPLSKD